MADVHGRPSTAHDVFVEVLPRTQAEPEPALGQQLQRRRLLRDDGRVVAHGRTGHVRHQRDPRGGLRGRSQHAPGVRRVTLLVQPREVVVGSHREVKARLLRPDHVGHQVLGARLLGHHGVSELRHMRRLPGRSGWKQPHTRVCGGGSRAAGWCGEAGRMMGECPGRRAPSRRPGSRSSGMSSAQPGGSPGNRFYRPRAFGWTRRDSDRYAAPGKAGIDGQVPSWPPPLSSVSVPAHLSPGRHPHRPYPRRPRPSHRPDPRFPPRRRRADHHRRGARPRPVRHRLRTRSLDIATAGRPPRTPSRPCSALRPPTHRGSDEMLSTRSAARRASGPGHP
ncbi:hypothetical protein SAMN05216252_14017 [Actinacidiphila glaucinigra]|uniref:Uncharacterized protein n=1 Tax=Actinacidiphila glaucinigra TaxID=235986 RepID=A0A239NM74_9ACTN|nr:hypothetical protein SAMN05216252_14017 [Actinacidiphila glaucinigra]